MSALGEVVEAVDPALARARGARPRARSLRRRWWPTPTALFVLEAVYEGYLLHYGEPRAFAGMDADLRLLAGDALYALGLSRLAESATWRPWPSSPT